MAMRWQTVEVPLASGINTKVDERALQPPALSRAMNAEFSDLGGIQKRRPYSALGTDVLGGGTIANPRRLAVYEDELLLFTKDNLYTYSNRDNAWVERAEYLAPKITERSVFVRTSEQITCDRAELDGVAVFAWKDADGHSYAAAIDTQTRAVLLEPTGLGSGVVRPRLLALNSKILLFMLVTSSVNALALDPEDLATSVAATPTSVLSNVQDYYDVAPLNATTAVIAGRRTVTTAYLVATVTEGLTATSATHSRTCDGPIAVTVAPDDHVVIVRGDGTNVEADLLLSDLTDDTANIALGTASTTIDQITVAARTTQDSGEYRCYAFWSAGETDSDTNFYCKSNYVDTGGSTGSEGTFVRRLGVASRAFDHDGRIFVWLVFAGNSRSTGMSVTEGVQVQNTYLLYRDDGRLIAKSAANVAGGFSGATGHLPNVEASGNTVTWCGVERRRIPVGGDGTAYAARAPREISLVFDSDEARRTAQIGRTLYVTGGQILQYDGDGLAEVGFHIYPWHFQWVSSAGSIDYTKDYTYKVTWRWDNAKGERERSTTATLAPVDLSSAGADQQVILSIVPLHTTLKQGDRTAPAIEVWRTLGDPTDDAPYYLTTDVDPTNDTGPNKYLASDTDTAYISYDEDLVDDDLDDRETNPENGGVLESIAPPAATIIAASYDRLFLAGIADDPQAIWYSKQRGVNDVVAFHDALVVRLPATGGSITALALLNETLIAFKESAIYALPGEGFDNSGGGQNLGPARELSRDVGAHSAEVVAVTPEGIVFHSSKGWYVLDRALSVRYIGGPVDEYDSDSFVAVHSLEDQHQIRCLSTSRALVLDTVAGQWAEWSISGGIDAVIYDGTYTYVDSTAVREESDDYTGVDYSLDVETAWIKLAQLQGFGRVRYVMALGEYRSAHDLRVRIARDYDDSSYFDDRTWTVDPTAAGGPLQVRHGPSVQKVQSIKVRLTDQAVGSATPPSGEGLQLTGLAFELGLKRGLRRLPAAQKQ